jgi:hypothetical protein
MKVSKPTLPQNINKISMNFAPVESWAVIPIDNPTVPRAEMTSNKTDLNGKGSMVERINVAKKIVHMYIAVIVRARKVSLS